MPIVSGRVIFDRDRTNSITAGDSGILGVPVVLQNINTGARITASTDVNGNYSFINVPNGSYRVVEAYGESGGSNPANFFLATIGAIPTEGDPPISSATNPPTGSTNLDSLNPNMLFVTVAGADIANVNFFDGPIIYTPISSILDSCAVIVPSNLITAADNGTFGSFPAGTANNTGAPGNPPYPGVTPDFQYTLLDPNFFIPTDGQYVIQNIMTNAKNQDNGVPGALNTWWKIPDHTTGNETGR